MKLKLRVRAEWEDLHAGDRADAANSGAYLKFMNQRLRQLLEAESEEVKAEVERFRSQRNSKPEDENDDPEQPLLPHETDLPELERERIKTARDRQR